MHKYYTIESLKLKFTGLKGFGDDSEYIEISPLTILTGQNGSGKSSYIKLIKLLKSSFSEVRSFNDIFHVTIDIGDHLNGGITNLRNKLKQSNITISFKSHFELYNNYNEIVLHLESQEYSLSVNKIKIYDSCAKVLLMEISNSNFSTYTQNLLPLYNEKVELYNKLEEYRYTKNHPDSNEITPKFYSKKKDKYLINKFSDRHIVDSDSSGLLYLGMTPSHYKINLEHKYEDFSSIPFLVEDLAEYGEYQYITPISMKNLEITKDVIKDILFRYSLSDLVNTIQSNFKRRFNIQVDLIDLLRLSVYSDLSTFILDDNFSYNSIISVLARRTKLNSTDLQALLMSHNQEDIEEVQDYIYEIEEELGTLHNTIVSQFFDLTHRLAEHSYKIFESGVLNFIYHICEVKFFSAVRAQPQRSFDIFESNNIYSSFLKFFRTLSESERAFKLKNINAQVRLLELADEVVISTNDNNGMISLVHHKEKFSIIDEGSGISNLISLILFLNSPSNKFLIIEEPESNLHPNLQSKLADLFVDFANKTKSKLLIETHSEYLIRKIQYLVAQRNATPENISLYYFDINKMREYSQISHYIIPISYEGILLKEFGVGFFDEAINLNIDLFTFLKSQKN